MSEAALLLEIDSLEMALSNAIRYQNSLSRLRNDEVAKNLRTAAEAQVQALKERLKAVRYLLHHPAEVRA